nr:hypothetical protein [Tanacetum cinerariifolium]
MVAILEKGEFNSDFHPMVDFIAASPLRYALTVKPTMFVSHIQQFWTSARIETTDEGTHILATVDDIQRTVSESSLRCNLKLRDEDGIVSIPDMELFENLTLMGYNISQKLTFQKGQFSHQWKYLIHTIMQCLSPKSTGFNEFSSNIATVLVCLATNRDPTPIKQYTRRARIAQSSALLTVADEPVSPIAKDAEVARIHAEKELQGMIDSLDKSNENIAKYLQEYQDFASELPLEKRIELIRWRFKDFKGMTFEVIESKFVEVWKQVEDFIPVGSKEETERLKRKGLNLEKEQVKKQKSLEEAPETETST